MYRQIRQGSKAVKILFSIQKDLARLPFMTRDQFITFCFVALLIFVVYQVGLIFFPFIQTIFWASILTFAFYPLYTTLRKNLIKNQTAASLIITIFIFLIVVIPMTFLIISLTSQ